MIKRITILAIIMTSIISGLSFADSLDTQYIDLIFDKFESYDDETKAERVERAKLFLANDSDSENMGPELLYNEIVKNRKDTMEKYNITESTLRRNIDTLKTWSIEDREALVDAGANGDRDTIVALNKKYSSIADDGNDSSSGGSGGGSGGNSGGGSGGSSGGNSDAGDVPETKLKTEPEKQLIKSDFDKFAGITKEERKETLKDKGLITREKEVVKDLKDKIFEDMNEHWAKDNVTFLAERGIIKGRENGEFDPNANVTKAETITLVLNLIVEDNLKISEAAVSSENLGDVDLSKWYADEIKNALSLKLIEKDEEGNLEPDKMLTREEVVEVLVNAVKAMGIYVDEENRTYPLQFSDFEKVQDSRKEAMAIAVKLGFVNGMGDGILAPKDLVTRGQMATLMKKVYLYLMEEI